MIRQAAAIVVALLLTPSWVAAQASQLAIGVTSADVHKSPSIASPVIGHAARGARLDVTREVGDWLKVSWPAASDGVGYVRRSMGSIVQPSTAVAAGTPAGVIPARAAGEQAPRLTASPTVDTQPAPRGVSARAVSAAPAGPSHLFGLGARLGGPSFGVGASLRGWSRGRFGVQFEISRSEISNPFDLGTVSSTQFGPSALFAFNDHVSDYTWLRPYVGAGVNFYRSTLTSPALGLDMSDSSAGFQAFGGGELSFSSLPQFAVSAELGYHWSESPFAGYEFGGIGLSVAGHWYMK